MDKGKQVSVWKTKLEEKLQAEIEGLEDASYVMFKDDFDEAIT